MRRLPLVAYAVCLSFVLLNSNASVPSGSVGWASGVADAWGTPDWLLESHRWEFLVNALVLVPLAPLGRWSWPERPVWQWALVGGLASVAVETVQALFLPERSATAIDVVANTTGAVAGCLLTVAVSRLRRAGGTRPTTPAARGRPPGPLS